MKTLLRSYLRTLTALAAFTVFPANALQLEFKADAPAPKAHDIFHLTGATRDSLNVGNGGTFADGNANDAFTYVAADRRNQGQTFTTGDLPGGYHLSSIWVRHAGYLANTATTSYQQPVGGRITVRLTDPARAGTASFAIRSESYTLTGEEPGKFPVVNTVTANGTGKWLRFTFDAPVFLQPSTSYGFDLTSLTDRNHFEWLGSQSGVYAGGGAYQGNTSGTAGGPDNALNALVGDRVFLLEMEPLGFHISRQPASIAAETGGTAIFEVETSVAGDLEYQWFKNGNAIEGATAAAFTIPGVSADDFAAYTVRISQSAGGVELFSEPAFLVPGDLGEYEPGLTFRLYDIREDMDRLYPLVPGQTPNLDEKRSAIDWTSASGFGDYSEKFLVECLADLRVTAAGEYAFRLTSSDGSQLWIDHNRVIDHDGLHGAVSAEGSATLSAGLHPLKLRFFKNTGNVVLRLEWRRPGTDHFEVVPPSAFLTHAGVTRVVAPGKKNLVRPGSGLRPGNGLPLDAVHPSWNLQAIRPPDFNPKVGAMAFDPDGRLLVATFEPNQNHTPLPLPGGDGKIWALDYPNGTDPTGVTVTEVASGLSEPLGMAFINGELHVSQRLAITRLRDMNGDGYYESKQDIGGGWLSNNYHHFHFGLIERDGFAYSTLSTSINHAYPALNGPNPPNRGTLVRTHLATGQVSYLAGGLRTPNGLCFGPEGEIFQTDNQGSWIPTSRLNHLQEGHFYGHRNATAGGGAPSLFSERKETPPAVWFPQNEVANSPSQPLLIPNGPFQGDLLIGDITMGGINRVSLEKVHGVWQGCIYRFTQGLEGGVNRLLWGPDGSLYIGCIGGSGNWSWNGTRTGLQRLSPKGDGVTAFEIKHVKATSKGFEIAYTRPVPLEILSNPAYYSIRQWGYQATVAYGGEKVGLETLEVSRITPSDDRTRVELEIPGVKRGNVIHLKSDPVSDDGSAILSSEAWYTLNEIPGGPHAVDLDGDEISENRPAGTVIGSFSAQHENSGENLVFSLPAGAANNAFFALQNDSTLVSAIAFDYERRSSYRVRVRVTDTAGLATEEEFEINVLDESQEHPPHRLLLSNAILPPEHAAGILIGRLLVDDKDLGDHQAIASSQASSGAIVYEPFDVPSGWAIAGLDGGLGFASAWQGPGTVATGSLSYTDIQGMALDVSGNKGTVPALSRAHRPLAEARGADGTVTYVSFIAAPVSNTHYWGVEFWNGAASTDNNRVLQIGNQNGFGVRVRNGTNKFFAFPDTVAHFFVVKIEHLTGNDRVSVWIDPQLAAESASPDLVFSPAETAGAVGFDRIGFADFVTTSTPAIDELRVGDDWAAVTPSRATFHRYEFVAGEGDADNSLFEIRGDRLFAAAALPRGLRTLRVKATDSAGLSREQPLLIWVGEGHLDSNNDGIIDADAVRMGLDPAGPAAPQSYFGDQGAASTFSSDAQSGLFQIESPALPGNLYWLESSTDLENWSLEPWSFTFPDTFLGARNGWEIPKPASPRQFWRVRGGWPDSHGVNPLANGLADLVIVGGVTGWSYDAATGVLRHNNTGAPGWAYFDTAYSDFLLSIDYQISPGGNAGVFLRATADGNPWQTGSEIQLTNEPRLPVHSTGSVYERIPAVPAADNRHSVWHRLEVLMIGHRIRVRVDGVTTVDVADARQAHPFNWPLSGLIGLQDSHASGGNYVEYRNLRIVALD